MAGITGIEPVTSNLTDLCFYQLSYIPNKVCTERFERSISPIQMARIPKFSHVQILIYVFRKNIQNFSTSIGYCPQFFALSRQPSTFEHILVYVVLLECAAHSTYQLKADYSTVELQKHGAHKKI